MGAEGSKLRPEKFTATGEPINDWIRHPKSFVDELILKRKLAPGVELTLLLVIERYTWGVGSNTEYFRASQAELARMCGVSRQAIEEPLRRLQAAGIIAWIPKGEAESGEKRGYRLMPENWPKVKAYVAPEEAQLLADARAAKKAAKAAKAALPVGFDADQRCVVLQPRHASILHIPLQIAGRKEKHDLPIRFLNEVDCELAFAPVTTETGLDVTVRRAAATAETLSDHPIASAGRIKSENQSTVVDNISPDILPKPKIKLSTVVDNSISQVVENKESHELLSNVVVQCREAYRKTLVPIFRDEIGKPLDEPFLERLIRASGGAPIEYFRAPLARLRKRGALTSGLILTIAKNEIATRWLAGHAPEAEAAAKKMAGREDSETMDLLRARFGNG